MNESWTPDLLKEYLDARILGLFRMQDDLHRELARISEKLSEFLPKDEYSVNHTYLEQIMKEALIAQEKAINTAFLAAEKAVAKAEIATEKRFDSVNEFRKTLSDQTTTFVTRDLFKGLEDRVDLSSSKLDKIEGKSSGINAGWLILVQFITIISSVTAIILVLAK